MPACQARFRLSPHVTVEGSNSAFRGRDRVKIEEGKKNVRRLERRRDQSVHRSRVDDAAPALFDHERQRGLGGVEGRGEADGDDGVPSAEKEEERFRFLKGSTRG